MAFNYTLETFIATPSSTDTKISIFDKNGTFKYSINPSLAYFFYKNNTIIIKVDDAETITLDFETNAIAISALEVLNDAKKTLTSQISDAIEYYSKEELNAGQLNNLYYTSGQTEDILLGYSETGHSHYITGLTDVVVSGLTNSEVLTYFDGQWVNSSFTFDTTILTNNYYSIVQLSGSNSATTSINWDNIINTPTTIDGYGITDAYTKSEVYNTGETYTKTEIAFDYYSKTLSNGLFLTITNAANEYSVTGHSHYLSGLTDVVSGATQNQTLIFSAGTWTPATIEEVIINEFYTSGQTDVILLGYSEIDHTHAYSALTNTAHTHNEIYYTEDELNAGQLNNLYYTETEIDITLSGYSLTSHTHDDRYYTSAQTDTILEDYSLITHTHALSALTNTAHTHDDRYYTETELDAGQLNNLYYTQTELNDGQLNNLYYTSAQTDTILEGYSVISHTHALSALTNTAHTHNDLYYTETEIDNTLLDYSLITHTHAYSALTNTAHTHNDLYYTETETDALLLRKSDTGHTHALSALTNTAHTHDDRYFVKEEFSGDTSSGIGVLDDRYYTKTVSDGFYYRKSELYTSAQTDALFDNYYTSGETDDILLGYELTSHTHSYSLSALTDVSFTGLTEGNLLIYSSGEWTNTGYSFDDYYTKVELLTDGVLDVRYYTETEINTIFYTSAQTDALITGVTEYVIDNYSNTGHSHDFTGLTTTAHTHDERYYTIDEFFGDVPDGGPGVLDNRYYTKILTYSQSEVDNLLSAITFSGATGIYYTKTQVDTLLDGKSPTGHTHALSGLTDTLISSPSDFQVLSYSGDVWVNSDLNVNFTGYYTSGDTDILLDGKSDIGHIHDDRYYTSGDTDTILLGYSVTSHTHDFTGLTNTAHTHDDLYYTKTESDINYYNKALTYNITEVNNLFDAYYTSGETDTLFENYYTSGETDTILLGYSETGHSHSITGLTDVVISSLTYQDVLVYSAGTWINSGITIDLTDYYNKVEVDNLISGLTFDISGATALYELTDVDDGITGATIGEALIYDGSIWINSAITTDFSDYYTSAQTDAIFFTSAQTSAMFSLTGHSHDLSGLTDVDSGATDGQFLQFSSGTWSPFSSPTLTGDFVSKSGDTMTGELTFDFMSNSSITERIMYLDTGGTIIEGSEVVSLYLTGSSLLDYISGETSWSGNTFIDSLTAYTLYDGQRYIDGSYFYEYLDSTLYRTYYASFDHNHDDRYYTETELLIGGVLDGRYVNISDTANTTLVSLTDTDIDISNLTNSDFLKYNTDSGWTNFYLDYTGLSYISDSVSSATTIYGISGLTGSGQLGTDETNIYIEHITGSTELLSNASATPQVVANLTFDSYGHVATWQRTDLSTYFPRTLEALTDVVLVGKTNNDYIYYNSSSLKWENRQLTKTGITDFTESDYVHITGAETITASKTFTNNVLIRANLTVSGTTTTISTEDLAIKDKIILLNSGETNYGIFGGISGIEIDRGLYDNFYILYDEGDSVYSSGGTLRIGVTGDTKYVAQREDNMTTDGISYWVSGHSNVTGYLDTNSSLTWSNGALNIDGDVNITNNLYITGNTIITGTTTHIGDFDITGDLTVTGDTYLYGDLNIDGYFLSGVSNDTGLTENSEHLLSTQYAIKTYVSTYNTKISSPLLSETFNNTDYVNTTDLSGLITVTGLSSVEQYDFPLWTKSNTTGFSYVHSMFNLNGFIYMSTRQFPARVAKINAEDFSDIQILTFPGTGSTSHYSAADRMIYSKENHKIYIPFGDPDYDRDLKVVEIDPDDITSYSVVIDETGNSIFPGFPTGIAKGNRLYILTGYESKLIEYDLSDFTKLRTLSGFTSGSAQAHAINIDEDFVYITEIYTGAQVQKVSLDTFTVVDSVALPTINLTDQFAISGQYLWVGDESTNSTNNAFYRINKNDLSDYKKIYIEDTEGTNFGLCSDGEYIWSTVQTSGVSSIYRINPETLEIRRKLLGSSYPMVNSVGFDGDNIYFSTFSGNTNLIKTSIQDLFDVYYAGSDNDVLMKISDTNKQVDIINLKLSDGITSSGITSNSALTDSSYLVTQDAIKTYVDNSSSVGTNAYWTSGTTAAFIVFNIVTLGNKSSGGDATGKYSIAEGYNTTASGKYSHTQGYGTSASGDYGSHAEGNQSDASGQASHAEGYDSESIGYASHSEGFRTTAHGNNSHSQGRDTISYGENSHVGGYYAIASGNTSFDHSYHTAGNTDSGATGDYSAILGGFDNWASGDYSFVAGGKGNVASGNRSYAEGMNTTSSGNYSHTEGYGTTASGNYGSHAEGNGTTASSVYGVCHAEGQSTTASGQYAHNHAEGFNTQATADYGASHAEGENSIASGDNGSHAEGYYTTSSGQYGAHSEGRNTLAAEVASHAEGSNSKAYGYGAHAGGYYAIADGSYSFDHSYHTVGNTDSGATGEYSAILGGRNNHIIVLSDDSAILAGTGNTISHARSIILGGYDQVTTATDTVYMMNLDVSGNVTGNTFYGDGSNLTGIASSSSYWVSGSTGTSSIKTVGNSGNATGNYAFASGNATTSSGNYSTASGYWTTASGNASHSEGTSTLASGDQSHTEGYNTVASGNRSHAEGHFSIASGNYSHAGGYYGIASGNTSFDHSYHTTFNTLSGATGIYSAILGGQFNHISISGESSAILAGTGNIINHARSVILGGQNITTSADDTVYGVNFSASTYYGDGSNLTGVGSSIPLINTTQYEPTGSTQEIDLDLGLAQTLSLSATTGTVVLTFVNPTLGNIYNLLVVQGANSVALSYPVTFKWNGQTPLIPTTTDGRTDIINMLWDGTNYYASYTTDY